MVLIVDQFEEVFTLCAEQAERNAFIDALGVLASGSAAVDATAGEPAALVVLGLRADFYGRCAAFPQLRNAVQRDQVLVGPMSTDELRSAIVRPALAVEMELEPGLVEVLLRDIGASDDGPQESGSYEAGRLPLIAYSLQETWRYRTGRTLTVAGYERTGGIRHAIATAAERTFAALPGDSQQEAQALFLRLIKFGDGTQDTRRAVGEHELLQNSGEPGAAQKALAAFIGARLLTSHQETVEISHEALLRAWPRLHQWISSDRADNLLRQELEDAAGLWERSGHDNSALLRGGRLDTATRWAGQALDRPGLSPVARTFLQESRRQQVRASQVRRAAVAVLAAVALVAATTAWFAFGQRGAAEASSREAILNQVTAEADQISATDPSLAAELNVLAYKMKPTAATYAKLVSAENTPLSSVLATRPAPVTSVAFSADGHTLAAATATSIQLWDTAGSSRRLLGTLPAGRSPAGVSSVVFSPSGILAAGSGASVRLWNVQDPSRARPLGGPLAADASAVTSVAFSPDGHTLAAAAGTGIQLWNVADPAHPQRLGLPLPANGGTVSSVAFSPGGHTLADAAGSEIQLWNTAGPGRPRPLGTAIGPLPYRDGHVSTILSIAFSSDSRTLAAGAADNYVHLWNVANPAQPVSLGYLPEHTESVTSVAFSSRGNILAARAARTIPRSYGCHRPGGLPGYV